MSEPTKTPQTQTAPSGGPPPPPKKTARGIDDLPPKGPSREVTASCDSPSPSALGLYVWLLRFFAIFLLVVVWAGYFFLERTWPAPIKLWLCTALGASAILHGIFGRSPSIRTIAPPGARLVISPLHACGVVTIVIAAGIFLTWVAVGPPH